MAIQQAGDPHVDLQGGNGLTPNGPSWRSPPGVWLRAGTRVFDVALHQPAGRVGDIVLGHDHRRR